MWSAITIDKNILSAIVDLVYISLSSIAFGAEETGFDPIHVRYNGGRSGGLDRKSFSSILEIGHFMRSSTHMLNIVMSRNEDRNFMGV